MNSRKKSSSHGTPSKEKEKSRAEIKSLQYQNIEIPSKPIFCELCETDVSKHTKVLDSEARLFLCLKCFGDGREDFKRRKTSKYFIINKTNFPLISKEWTAEEELLLLEALEKYGFGNWEEISKHIETKTKEECEEHYEDEFISRVRGDKTGLESLKTLTVKDLATGAIVSTVKPISSKKRKTLPEETQHEKNSNGLARSSLTLGSSLSQEDQFKKRENTKEKQALGTESINEIVGFMPLRGDFDCEYDNDAELLLAEMEFAEDDSPEEIELKYRILEIYNKRLDQRIKRKQFVIQHGLLNIRKQTTLDRLRSKEEKEIYNSLKPFARFSTPEDHEKLISGLIRERELRKRIDELSFYKKQGLKTFQDIENYLNEKKKKDESFLKKQKSSENYVYDPKISSRLSSVNKRTRVTNTHFYLFLEFNSSRRMNLIETGT